MREDAFRAFLVAAGYTSGSVSSRLSRARAVERRLQIDLDSLALDARGMARLRERVTAVEPKAAIRINLLNAVRTYARFRGNGTGNHGAMPMASASGTTPRSSFIATASVPELMRLYADVLGELRHRGVTRTGNGPVGDFAELLFARAFGWTLAGSSAAHYDATDAAGTRYQIKARRAVGAGGRQLGIIRRLPEARFDLLAALLFDADLQVARAALIPHRVVIERAAYVAHVNGWRLMLTDEVLALPTVRDATDALRSAARSI